MGSLPHAIDETITKSNANACFLNIGFSPKTLQWRSYL